MLPTGIWKDRADGETAAAPGERSEFAEPPPCFQAMEPGNTSRLPAETETAQAAANNSVPTDDGAVHRPGEAAGSLQGVKSGTETKTVERQ